MEAPEFFARVEGITLTDPLADFLGAAEGGLMRYGYGDAVKLAGHSCPTVAAAYWLGVRALQQLYQNEVPVRGGVRVDLRQPLEAGTTGVTATVLGLLTGAASAGGFAGIGGRFVRRNLLHFAVEIPTDLRFTRLDSGQSVLAQAHVKRVSANPNTMRLMQACLSGTASSEQRREFGELWQEHVERLLIVHAFDDEVFEIRTA